MSPGSGVRGCSHLLCDGAFSLSASLAYVRRCEELKQRLIKEVSPCYLVPGNSLGRDSPVRLGWVSGAGRDCSASGPCQKVKLGEGMRLLVSKQVI